MDELYLYARAGCHLCDDTRRALVHLLADRTAAGLPSPILVERDIEADEAWQRAFMTTIPVIELGGQRLVLATSPTRIRRFLADTLDVPAAARG
jgi:glutaredoxin